MAVVTNDFKYTTGWVAMRGLRLLKNKLVCAKYMSREQEREFRRDFPIGESFSVPLPYEPTIRTGLEYTPTAIERRTTTVTMETPFGSDLEWDSIDRAMRMNKSESEIEQAYIEPTMNRIAQRLDRMAMQYMYIHTPNVVGALGTDPTTMTTFGSIRQRMVERGCPPAGKRAMLIAPQINTSMVNAMSDKFQAADALAQQYKEGAIGRFQGFDWFESMSIYTHTAGTWAGAVTVNGASQTGASLNINCTSGDSFKAGDKIGIGGIYAVNIATKGITTTATTMQVTVLADVTASAATATLSIYPAISGPGSPYQNVDALPANLAALTLWPGTSSPNGKVGKVSLAVHKDAFGLLGVPLDNPKAGAEEMVSQATDPETGISIAYIRWFNRESRKWCNRFDTYNGFATYHADACAVALAGA